MILEKTLIRRVALRGAFGLGIFAVIPRLAGAQTPSPALLITIQGPPGVRALAIADPLTMKVVGSVPLVGNPHDVAVSPDGLLAYVTTNNGGGRPGLTREEHKSPGNEYISVIDLVGQKELRRFETGLGSFPHGIRFARGKLFFSSEGYKLVGRYDPAGNRIDWMMGLGQHHPHELVVTRDQRKIFTSHEFSNSVTAITEDPDVIHSPWKVTVIPVGKVPEGITMSPDEKEVWVANKSDSTVSIIDTSTLKVTQTFSLKPAIEVPIRLQFTPDGKRVIVADNYSGEVLVLDAVTQKEIKRISLGEQAKDYQVVPANAGVGSKVLRGGVEVEDTDNKVQNLVISSDSSHMYLTNSGSSRITIVNLKTFAVTGHIPVRKEPEGIAWAERKGESSMELHIMK